MNRVLRFFKGFIICIAMMIVVWYVSHPAPLFTVIVSVYNYEKYVEETIKSILVDSDYPRLELILVNDGSTDHSLDILRKWEKRDRRVKVIDQENQGLSSARNNAMKIAKGDYFWFVDADDYIDKKAFTRMEEQIKKTNKPDLISFLVQPISENGSLMEQDFYSQLPSELKEFKNTTFNGRDIPIKAIYYYPVTSGKQIYSRKFLEKHHIRFIPNLVFEDDCFFLTILEANARGTAIFENLYYKRIHNKSITADKKRFYDSTCRLPVEIYKAVKKVGSTEERARLLFKFYFSGIFDKFPGRKKDLIELEKILNFIQNQPPDEFWKENENRLKAFIEEKKNLHLK